MENKQNFWVEINLLREAQNNLMNLIKRFEEIKTLDERKKLELNEEFKQVNGLLAHHVYQYFKLIDIGKDENLDEVESLKEESESESDIEA